MFEDQAKTYRVMTQHHRIKVLETKTHDLLLWCAPLLHLFSVIFTQSQGMSPNILCVGQRAIVPKY